MRIFFLPIIALLFVSTTSAQTTWSEDAAAIFFANCTQCHNPKGIAPFSLMDYQTAAAYEHQIGHEVGANKMPPWTADTSYQRYSHERILTKSEKDIILNWIYDGALEGNPSLAPPPPVYTNDRVLQNTPDLQLKMPTYRSKATASFDDYVCFAIPTGVLVDKKIKAIEIIPGNLQTVHHALVYIDTAATYPTDTVGSNCAGPPDGFIAAYIPGGSPTIFPSSVNFRTGISLPAGSNIVLAMHYPEGSFGMADSTKVNFYFYDNTAPVREIYASAILQDWSFTIKANTKDSVEAVYPSTGGVPYNFTMLSVFPHMHKLGNTIESYSVSPSNDTTPYIRIPDWDFEWQDFFFFKNPLKLPSGSTIHGKAVYDNTVNNLENPNNPPIDVHAGVNTSDEMFIITYHFMVYSPGDEDINVDSLTQVYLSDNTLSVDDKTSTIKVYPNPFKDVTTFEYELTEDEFISIFLYDTRGRLIRKLIQEKQQKGLHTVDWNGKSDQNTKVNPGVYYYSILINGKHTANKVILRN